MKVFLSYSFHNEDQRFVERVYRYLREQADLGVDIEPFFWGKDRGPDPFPAQLEEALASCDVFILFQGSEMGAAQHHEMEQVLERNDCKKLWVQLSEKVPQAAFGYCQELDAVSRLKDLNRRLPRSTKAASRWRRNTSVAPARLPNERKHNAKEASSRRDADAQRTGALAETKGRKGGADAAFCVTDQQPAIS